jgi:uncharacterized protein (DUF1499 family)
MPHMVRAALAVCGVALVGLALLMSAGLSYRLGLLSLPGAFGLLRWGAYLAVAGMLAAGVASVFAYRRRRWYVLALLSVAFVLSTVAFAIPYQWQRTARAVPPIHDITTDLEHPPAFTATVVRIRGEAANPLEHREEVGAQQKQAYPDIAPVTLPSPPAVVFDDALQVAREMGWEILTADRTAGRIEATDTTRWFGFQDDVHVRLTPWGSGTRVDVRSVSRVGRSDVGTNARRIRRYLDRLQRH